MKNVCVYCGSSPGRWQDYERAAQTLADTLVSRGLGLVYGGASVGTMGMLADAVLQAGGRAVGVIPRSLVAKEVSHHGLSELHVVESMHERKAMMEQLSDGFIAMPGGLGTLEELFEILTWGQLGFHSKPCGLLNTRGYFNQLCAFLDHSVEEGFVKHEHRNSLLIADRAEVLLDKMVEWRAPKGEKWIDGDGL